MKIDNLTIISIIVSVILAAATVWQAWEAHAARMDAKEQKSRANQAVENQQVAEQQKQKLILELQSRRDTIKAETSLR